MREFLRDVDQRLQTDEAKAATQEFNQLIEDLANKRLDRTEAFRRMQQLEDKLMQESRKMLREGRQTIAEIAGRLTFDTSNFTKFFKRFACGSSSTAQHLYRNCGRVEE